MGCVEVTLQQLCKRISTKVTQQVRLLKKGTLLFYPEFSAVVEKVVAVVIAIQELHWYDYASTVIILQNELPSNKLPSMKLPNPITSLKFGILEGRR